MKPNPLHRYSTRSLQVRLFLTCWLIFCLHFATNFVREHYLALSLAERASFRVDDDLLGFTSDTDVFEVPGYGVHIGGNPGASMVAAVTLAPFMPIINEVNEAVQEKRSQTGDIPEEPVYRDRHRNDRVFYQKVWQRGLDVKFGLIGAITVIFGTAIWSALSAVVIFSILMKAGLTRRGALFFSFLYALGTPIFFRTGHLSHNLLVSHLTLFSFAILFHYGQRSAYKKVLFGAGFFAGMTILTDYSGALILLALAAYAWVLRQKQTGAWQAVWEMVWFAAGAVLPVGLLLFYQYQSFGHPIYPPQHYMPRPTFLPEGYPKSGFGWPTFDLLWRTLLDIRYGMFAFCPMLVLGIYSLIRLRMKKALFSGRERIFFVGIFVVLWVFFSSTQYTSILWNTGFRYLIPAVPLLFLGAVEILRMWPRRVVYFIAVFTLAESWCISMVREERGVIDSVASVMTSGFQLPWLTTLEKMAPQYLPYLETGASPLPLFLLFGAIIYGIWSAPALFGEGRPAYALPVQSSADDHDHPPQRSPESRPRFADASRRTPEESTHRY